MPATLARLTVVGARLAGVLQGLEQRHGTSPGETAAPENSSPGISKHQMGPPMAPDPDPASTSALECSEAVALVEPISDAHSVARSPSGPLTSPSVEFEFPGVLEDRTIGAQVLTPTATSVQHLETSRIFCSR